MGKLFGLAAAATLCSRPFQRRVNGSRRGASRIRYRRTDRYHRVRDYSARVRQACTRNSSQVCRPLSSAQPRETLCLKVMGLHPVAWQYCDFRI